jgi:rSAM/selenodomain-associated transferase 2
MISVIIPAINEGQTLGRAISAVRKSHAANEIVVVDGGSSDDTATIAEESGARVILSPIRQRAAQMNLGAEHSKGELLLFLHADTILPASALDTIEEALKNGLVAGGGFARRFDSPSLFLKCTCLLAEFRNRTIGWFLGDQGLFVRRAGFLELSGFRIVDRFEDLDFSRRLGHLGRLVTLRPPVLTSSRRFEREGPFGRTVRDFLLTMRYLKGEPSATEVVWKSDHKDHVSYPSLRK